MKEATDTREKERKGKKRMDRGRLGRKKRERDSTEEQKRTEHTNKGK